MQQSTVKQMKELREICEGRADVVKVRGRNAATIFFYKNWGHGKLVPDKTQGTLGCLLAAGFKVTQGHYGNTYDVAL